MTEAEWSSCTNPEKMLAFVRGRASERKLRLFGCACCRAIWGLTVSSRGNEHLCADTLALASPDIDRPFRKGATRVAVVRPPARR